MQDPTSHQDSWWHERPTKPAELGTDYQPLHRPRKRDSVWQKAALVVGVVFALVVTVILSMARH